MKRLYEAEVANELGKIAENEMRKSLGISTVHHLPRGDGVQFEYDGDIAKVLQLGTVISVYVVLQFDIPRPKALLGHQHYTRLINTIQQVHGFTRDDYASLHISAAGSNSPTMMRIKDSLANDLNLEVAQDEGDLLLRIRRTPKQKRGWDVLVRVGARPLATRPWRIHDMPGALNASVARAMMHMLQPKLTDLLLNIGCGSGTLLIEGGLSYPAQQLIGCDISTTALDLASGNIDVGGISPVDLIRCDAKKMPFADSSMDVICADLPFGQLVGSHEKNLTLYPAMMDEAARVAKHGARCAIITHEVRLFEDTITQNPNWETQHVQKITLSGLHPRIYILKRI